MPTRKAEIRVFHSCKPFSKTEVASSPSAITVAFLISRWAIGRSPWLGKDLLGGSSFSSSILSSSKAINLFAIEPVGTDLAIPFSTGLRTRPATRVPVKTSDSSAFNFSKTLDATT